MAGVRNVDRRLFAAGGAAAIALAAALLSCALRESSAATAVNLLQRMLDAERVVAYEGMKAVQFGEGRFPEQALFVKRGRDGSTLVEPAGQPAGRRRQWREWRSRLYWLGDLGLLLRNYRIMDGGPETVAGRAGRALRVLPEHRGRPSARLVVDDETGLLLSTEFLDHEGGLWFRSRFSTLLIDPWPIRRKGRETEVERRFGAASDAAEVSFGPMAPRHLPEGFELRGRFVRDGREPVLRQVYADGLTWLELEQRRAADGEPERVVRQSRAGSRISMRMVLGGVAVRLVGRIDPAEMLEVLESLAPEREVSIWGSRDAAGPYNVGRIGTGTRYAMQPAWRAEAGLPAVVDGMAVVLTASGPGRR